MDRNRWDLPSPYHYGIQFACDSSWSSADLRSRHAPNHRRLIGWLLLRARTRGALPGSPDAGQSCSTWKHTMNHFPSGRRYCPRPALLPSTTSRTPSTPTNCPRILTPSVLTSLDDTEPCPNRTRTSRLKRVASRHSQRLQIASRNSKTGQLCHRTIRVSKIALPLIRPPHGNRPQLRRRTAPRASLHL